MPDPVDIYARLRFQQGTVAADARAAMETARKEFAAGINVPLRFQQQGGVGGGTAGGGGGGGGGIGGGVSRQARPANVRQQGETGSDTFRRLATESVARALGGGAAATAAQAPRPQPPAPPPLPPGWTVQGGELRRKYPEIDEFNRELQQSARGLRNLSRVAAVAESVSLAVEGTQAFGKLAAFNARGQAFSAAQEADTLKRTIQSIPFVGRPASIVGGGIGEMLSGVANQYRRGGGGAAGVGLASLSGLNQFLGPFSPFAGNKALSLEGDEAYAARLEQERRVNDQIEQMRAQRQRAFMKPAEANLQETEDLGRRFGQTPEQMLLKEQNPEAYAKMVTEIGKQVGVARKKYQLSEEHDDFEHQQKLSRIQSDSEVARMEASGNRLGAERKQLSDHFDQEIAAAQEAAKEYREVNRDKDAQEAEDEAKSLAGLKAARLAEFDAQNRIIGFHTGMDLWRRMAEAAARYTETVKGAGDATVAAASKAQGATKPAAAAAATDYGAQAENIRGVLGKQGAELPEEFTDRAGLLTAARNYDALRKQATDPKEKTRYATIAATIRHLIQVNAAARLGHQVGATPGGMPRGTEEFDTSFTEEAQQAEEQGGTPEFLGAQQQRAMEARMRLNLQKKKRPAITLDQGGDFAALAGTTAAPSAEDLTPTLASGGVRDIALADGSFDKFKRAMKEAMRETGAQFELIK